MSGKTSCFLVLFFVALFTLSGCKKDESSPVTDIDGNVYKTVVIGERVWMAENLRVTRLNDGTEIKPVESGEEWQNIAAPAFSWYDNDQSQYAQPYGALYNGYVIESKKICPQGWHVPTVNNLLELVATLGDTLTGGGKLKVEGTSQWHAPNEGADNSSQFSALPAGMRYPFQGTFSSASYFTGYWSSTEVSADTMAFISLSYLNPEISFSNSSKKTGLSIRCVKTVY